MNGEEIREVWERFAENNDFKLNPDKKHVGMLVKGVMENEKRYGLKLCPCRLRDGTKETDLKLICPCNFKAQEVWRTKGRCWCGLFIRR